jgi:hypothetical protein
MEKDNKNCLKLNKKIIILIQFKTLQKKFINHKNNVI